MPQPSLSETTAFVRQAYYALGKHSTYDHTIRVLNYLPPNATDQQRYIALLHDVLEDTPLNIDQFSLPIRAAVELLTRRKPMTYPEYIDRLIQSKNRDAIIVKIADNTDNTDTKRMMMLNAFKQKALRERYAGLIPRLQKALTQCP